MPTQIFLRDFFNVKQCLSHKTKLNSQPNRGVEVILAPSYIFRKKKNSDFSSQISSCFEFI